MADANTARRQYGPPFEYKWQERDSTTAEAVHALFETCPESRALLDARHSLQEIWKPASQEDQDRFRMAFDTHHWMIVHMHPLAHNINSRAGQLCAAGNAIVPQVAAEFIKAAP
jgi:hypothetical protein